MEISKNMYVAFDYTLTNNEGEVLDTSEGREPLAYIQGSGQIIPGLENEMEGKQTNDKFKAVIEPAEAYGEWDDAAVHKVEKVHFEGIDGLQEGMQLQMQNPMGMQVVTVKKIEDDFVVLDANHPLAGVTLTFDVTVTEVRDATGEELAELENHECSSCQDCGEDGGCSDGGCVQ